MRISAEIANFATLMRRSRGYLIYGVIGLGVAAVAGCNLGSVGKQAQSVPTAVVSAIGQPYTTDSSGTVNTTVRAGSDVVLSGNNSHKSYSDTGVPITQFQWQRTDSGADAIQLVARTSSTVSFTAPQVLAQTTLNFRLTVTDANGQTSTANATVTVLPFRDADHFLKYLATNDRFTVTAATSAPVPKSSAAYDVIIPYTVTVTKLVRFTDNNKVTTTAQVGTPVTYNGGWSAALGSGGTDCTNPLNPKITVSVPSVNFDDVVTDSSSAYNGQPLSNVMQASDIDLDPAVITIPPAQASAKIDIAFGTVSSGDSTHVAAPAGVKAYLCAGSTGTATAATFTETSEQMLSAANSPNALRDNSVTASAYYHTIDPNGSKTDLAGWLMLNGFDSSASDYGAAAKPASIFHATYTNNYDLGLGRDMYMSVGPCDAGFESKPLQQRIGHCDVASVVVNYGGVEAAAKKQNAIVAVAMEYTGPAAGMGPRFTKFYTFAPDTRTGNFLRVSSVDLDHRGQKYLPQACVVCHGGVPAGGVGALVNGMYPSTAGTTVNGDVNAGFLPWDLDSFWYSDTDPGFSDKPEDAALKAQYTRANQEAQLKMLNSGAYLTLAHATAGTNDPYRYTLLQELLEGWYAQGGSGVGLPGNFDGSFVPPGWSESMNGNPQTSGSATGSKTIYLDVFARTCRACHILQAPAAGIIPNDTKLCTAAAPASTLGGTNQFPMGCYWQFMHTTDLAAMTSEGLMPLARRTMDRLWVDPAGATTTKGQELLDHLNNQYKQPGAPQDTTHTPPEPFVAVAPGTANVYIAAFGATTPSNCSSPPPTNSCNDILSWVPLTLIDNGYSDPRVGDLIAQPSWQVCAKGSGANCAGAAGHVPVVGTGLDSVVFQIPTVSSTAASPYSLLTELDSASTPAADQTLNVILSAPVPSSSGLPTNILSLGTVSISSALVKSTISASPGNGPYSAHTWWISNLSADLSVSTAGSNCVVGSPCQLDCPSGTTCAPVTAVLQQSSFAPNPAYTLNVADADGRSGAVAITMATQSGIVVNLQTGYIAEYAPDTAVSASSTNLIARPVDHEKISASCTNLGNCLDLAAGNPLPNAATQAWQAQILCGATWTTTCALGSNSQGQGTITIVGTHVQYAAPAGFATSGPNGSSIGALQSSYRLLLVSQANPATVLDQSPAATLQIDVLSRVSWSGDVAPVFSATSSNGGTCISCHFSGTTYSGPDGNPIINFNTDAHSLFCALAGGGSCTTGPLTPTTNPGASYVKPSAVLSSVLVAHPAESDLSAPHDAGLHTGLNRCPAPASPPGAAQFTTSSPITANDPVHCDLLNILYWIEDGAYEN